MLLSVGVTASSRQGGFPDAAEPLDAGGARDAVLCHLSERFSGNVFRTPARAGSETAEAMGLAAREDAALADIGQGPWTGRSLDDVAAAESKALSNWLANPAAGVPGGETMESARLRIGRWLDTQVEADAAVTAITHPMIIRAAVAHALGLRLKSTLAIDIAPLSRTVLSFNRMWRLQSLSCSG